MSNLPSSSPDSPQALRELIETGRQRVFIPRKGYATFVLCVERDEPEPHKWKPASESLLAALRSSSAGDEPREEKAEAELSALRAQLQGLSDSMRKKAAHLRRKIELSPNIRLNEQRVGAADELTMAADQLEAILSPKEESKD